MHALVIDDSRAMLGILEKMLTEVGFEVTLAGDGREALAELQAGGPFDVALVDWNMPELDGYEFIEAVRADHAYDGLLLMMVTSETEISRVAKALEAGANEYVMKPFTKEVLIEKLEILGLVEADTCAKSES